MPLQAPKSHELPLFIIIDLSAYTNEFKQVLNDKEVCGFSNKELKLKKKKIYIYIYIYKKT